MDNILGAYESILYAVRQNVENMVLSKSNPGDHTEHKGFINRIQQEYR